MSDASVDQPLPDRQDLDPLPGIIQFGSINLLAGAPGVGKTALTAWILRQLRDGDEVFGRRSTPPPLIAYFCVDRGWYVARTWLDRVGFGPIRYYSLADDDTFNLDILHNKRARLVVLKQCLEKLGELPWGTVVVIDPIALFMGGNLNDYDTCAIFLIGIRRLIRSMGLTVIGLTHSGKQKNDQKEQYKRLQDRIVGSTAQHGYADTQMYLASPDEMGEKFYTFIWAPHLERAEAFRLGRDEQTGLFIPWTLPTHASEEEIVADKIAAEGTVLASVPDHPVDIGFAEVCVLHPTLNRATVNRYLNRLIQEQLIIRCGHGRYQRPPKH